MTCNGKQSGFSLSSGNILGFKTRGVKLQKPFFSFGFFGSLLTTVGSDLKGTASDAMGLLGSNTRVVLTKNEFFLEEISLGSAGMLMTVRGKMIP